MKVRTSFVSNSSSSSFLLFLKSFSDGFMTLDELSKFRNRGEYEDDSSFHFSSSDDEKNVVALIEGGEYRFVYGDMDWGGMESFEDFVRDVLKGKIFWENL